MYEARILRAHRTTTHRSTTIASPLHLSLTDYLDSTRWRWVLSDRTSHA
jgi:hypothetical protein